MTTPTDKQITQVYKGHDGTVPVFMSNEYPASVEAHTERDGISLLI